MKTILFPTDFSDTAENAFEFAVNIAKAIGGELILLHTYRVPLDYHIPANLLESMAEDEHKTVNNILNKLIATYFEAHPEAKSKVALTPMAIQGFTADVISEAAKSNHVDMIVMGTNGATGLEKIFLGSMTTTVIDKAHCPVLAVPNGATFEGFKQLIYASDFSPSDLEAISQLRAFGKLFDANIHCIHVSDDENYFIDDVSFDLMKENYFKQHPDAAKNVDFHVLLGEDLEDGLKAAISTYSANLIAMITRKESFFERLFSGSDTKEMAYESDIPILAFHERIS